MRDGPTRDDSVVDFPLLDPDNEMHGSVPHPLLEVLNQLLSVFAKIDIDPFGLSLKDAVFVNQNESHLIVRI